MVCPKKENKIELFRLTQTGDEAGGPLGGCAPYKVDFRRESTVREFIESVLCQNEWGYIGIYSTEPDGVFFGKPCCEYSRNHLKSHLPEKYLDRKIKKAKASGGYSRMDYVLYLFKEGEY